MGVEVRGMQANIDDSVMRERAVERLKKKRDFKSHLLAFVLVNAALVGIWAATGAAFFWPIFPIMGWGIGLVFHAWDTYGQQAPTEKEISKEIDTLRRKQA